jgi:arabinogalactan endo-1,4-beta-galactosidase
VSHSAHRARRARRARRIGLVVLAGLGALTVATLVIALTLGEQSRRAPLSIRGADISFTLQNEAALSSVSAHGAVRPVEQILAGNGATYVRLRVWVNPAPGTSDLTAALELARRATAAGLEVLLDLHYSDTWADGSSQQTPAAWSRQDARTLEASVERYTGSVLRAFEQQNTPVSIVQLGNEITNGMLWPTGKLDGFGEDNWSAFAGLLRAADRGVNASGLSDPPAVMIHTDTTADLSASIRFFDRLVESGIHVDLIGLSYYPFWHGSLTHLAENLAALAERYDTDMLIAETSYPWTLADFDDEPNQLQNAGQLPDGDRFAPTPTGQQAYFQALRAVLAAVPGNHGTGFLVWEPAWRAGVPADSTHGNAYDNLTLFDADGRALPALDAFAPPSL